jgi:hypothetical protein
VSFQFLWDALGIQRGLAAMLCRALNSCDPLGQSSHWLNLESGKLWLLAKRGIRWTTWMAHQPPLSS